MTDKNQQKNTTVRFAVVTISDTRDYSTDKSGTYLARSIAEAGHIVTAHHLVRDLKSEIVAIIEQLTGEESACEVIITTGGTGLASKDVTIDALEPLFDKTITGFAVLFHLLSYNKIGTSTVQSRVNAGIINNRFIFCLPGSPSACKDAWQNILVQQFDIDHKPCNFVEIMPRITEKS